MPDYEARINTKFGQLVIHFSDKSELDKRLDGIAELVQTLETKSAGFAVIEERSAFGLEGICSITPDGLPKLLVYPKMDSDKVRLALFASREPLSSDEITKVTGVENSTALRFMKFEQVIRAGGKYTLSGKGRTFVTMKILPKLRPKEES
jgi:hypothetical protein